MKSAARRLPFFTLIEVTAFLPMPEVLEAAPGGRAPSRAILLAMADISEITRMIETALPGAEVHVQDHGGGDHLSATVVAAQFTGLGRIDQHKLVYAAVQSRFDDGSIHALALKTRTPEAA